MALIVYQPEQEEGGLFDSPLCGLAHTGIPGGHYTS